MKGNKSNNRQHTHWLSVDSQAGSSPRSSSCCTWNTCLILSGTTSLSGASAHDPGASELGSLQQTPWRKCFFLASCFFSHPCCSAQDETLTLSGWGRKLPPGVKRGASALLWISAVSPLSKLRFIVKQNNSYWCQGWSWVFISTSKIFSVSVFMRFWHHCAAKSVFTVFGNVIIWTYKKRHLLFLFFFK